MIGITLSSEQIRHAPAEVRRWIEREVMSSMGHDAPRDTTDQSCGGRLAACSQEQVMALLSQIRGVLPAVNVFFEFGRQGVLLNRSGIESFRLIDIAHHTRLQNIRQVVACLDLISQAFAQVCSDPDMAFCGFDREGNCFITQETQQNIFKVWQTIIATQQLPALDQEKDLSLANSGSSRVNGTAARNAQSGNPA